MDTIEDKINNLDQRISKVSDQITDLEQTKVNLMILKREFQFNNTKEMLEDSYRKVLELDLDKVIRSHRD